MPIEPVTLRGAHVELIPLDVAHAEQLAEAAEGDRGTYAFTEVPEGTGAMAAYITKLLRLRDQAAALPFAQRRLADDRLVGCTRLMELRWWRGRAVPDEAEVGGTWLAAEAQRSALNTEAKLLLLGHAFETWQVWRVALCTDARNERSRVAIERIGARFEGVLHNHRPSAVAGEQGRPRDSALFAITAADWPGVRERLQRLLLHPRV